MDVRIAQPQLREILVKTEFVQNVASVCRGIDAEHEQMAALVELRHPRLAKVEPALDLVHEVLLDDAVCSDPRDAVERDVRKVLQSRPVVGLWL